VGRVAGGAASLFDGWVFVNPWSGKIGVAFQTCRCLLRNACLQARLECVVRIVTIGALNGSVAGLVVCRLGELGLNSHVALIAKCGLRRFQQLPFFA